MCTHTRRESSEADTSAAAGKFVYERERERARERERERKRERERERVFVICVREISHTRARMYYIYTFRHLKRSGADASSAASDPIWRVARAGEPVFGDVL